MQRLPEYRSRARYLLIAVLLAGLFPAVQMLTSVGFSFLTRLSVGETAAGELSRRAEYILTVNSVSQVLALVVIAWYAARVTRVGTTRYFGEFFGERRISGHGAALIGPVLILTVGAQMVESGLLSIFEIELGAYEEIAEMIFQANFAVVIVTVALVPGICEELIFRGIIQPFAIRGAGPVIGIVYTAAIFGIVHLVPIQIFAGFLFGLVFGYICYRADAVWLAVLSHIAANGMVALVGHAASEAGTRPEELASDAVSTGGLIAVLSFGVIVAAAGVVWFEAIVRRRYRGSAG